MYICIGSLLSWQQFKTVFSKVMCSLDYLPIELLVLIFHFLKINDLVKCSHVNKKWQNIVIQYFIKPQLVVFAKLDKGLKKSFYQEGWDKNSNNYDLIVKLWKKYQPYKGRKRKYLSKYNLNWIMKFFPHFDLCI